MKVDNFEIPDFKGESYSFTMKYDVSCCFFIDTLCPVEKIPF